MGADITIAVEVNKCGEWELFATFPNMGRYTKQMTYLRERANGWPSGITSSRQFTQENFLKDSETRLDVDTIVFFEAECSTGSVGWMTMAEAEDFGFMNNTVLSIEFRAILKMMQMLNSDKDSPPRLIYGFDQ